MAIASPLDEAFSTAIIDLRTRVKSLEEDCARESHGPAYGLHQVGRANAAQPPSSLTSHIVSQEDAMLRTTALAEAIRCASGLEATEQTIARASKFEAFLRGEPRA